MSRSTTCDTKKEKICDEKLSELVKILENHRDRTLDFVKTQKKILEKIWRLSVRYDIIKKNSLEIYPVQLRQDVKAGMIEDASIKLETMRDEIKILFFAQNKFRQKHREFEAATNELDLKVESTFIQGGPAQKPLKFYLTVFLDILFCFDVFLLHLKTYEDMLTIEEIETVDKFKKALYLKDNFLEYINHVISSYNCKGSIGS